MNWSDGAEVEYLSEPEFPSVMLTVRIFLHLGFLPDICSVSGKHSGSVYRKKRQEIPFQFMARPLWV